MKSCPQCFNMNPSVAATCERCGSSLDAKPINLGRTCPAGRHVMDPSRSECDYCKAEALAANSVSGPAAYRPGAEGKFASSRSTVDERSSDGLGPTTAAALHDIRAGQSGRRTVVESSAAGSPSPGRRAGQGTVFDGGEALSGPAAQAQQRKIVGILITYTWKPEGQIFPVRQGRNWIGKDPALADIVVEQDKTLSGVNSTIQYQTGFRLNDKDSMNGTFLNGMPVEESCSLPNYATLRTGSTTWTFIAIEPERPDGSSG